MAGIQAKNSDIKKINDEYNAFISKKSETQKYVKDFTTKMCKQIDELTIPSLSLYLSTKYTSVSNYIICECDFQTLDSRKLTDLNDNKNAYDILSILKKNL